MIPEEHIPIFNNLHLQLMKCILSQESFDWNSIESQFGPIVEISNSACFSVIQFKFDKAQPNIFKRKKILGIGKILVCIYYYLHLAGRIVRRLSRKLFGHY